MVDRGTREPAMDSCVCGVDTLMLKQQRDPTLAPDIPIRAVIERSAVSRGRQRTDRHERACAGRIEQQVRARDNGPVDRPGFEVPEREMGGGQTRGTSCIDR